MTPYQAAEIFNEAWQAGRKAVETARVEPMTVIGGGKSYFVADGVCGFAGIVIRPARGPLVSYLKQNKIGRAHYAGGYYVPVHDYNQSMQRKEAHAAAVVEVLTRHGVECRLDSRMD